MAPKSREVPVLFDHDVVSLADMRNLVEVCRTAVSDDVAGTLSAPPRLHVDLSGGSVVFTVGASADLFGFRAYETFPDSHQDQVVAVWNRKKGELAGVVVGDQLGAYRTGALGGVAVDLLAPPNARSCAVIGTGRQATTQLLAAAAVRDLDDIRCYSPTPDNRRGFAERMQQALEMEVVPVNDVKSATTDAEIVLVATTSREPIIHSQDLRPDAHLSTVGPKFSFAHEVSADLVDGAWLIASDSPQQVRAWGADRFLGGERTLNHIQHLGAIDPVPAERAGRTCYLSAGLAGTEVMVAAHLLRSREFGTESVQPNGP